MNYTGLACCVADGEYKPLHFLYQAVRLKSSLTLKGPPCTHYDLSPSGWMQTKQFERNKNKFNKFKIVIYKELLKHLKGGFVLNL